MSIFLQRVLLANIYLQPIQFILGFTANILSIRIFSSRALRTSSCTQYFLAYAIFSLIYVFLLCPTQFLRGFNIDWTTNPIGCKISLYIFFLPSISGRLMLLLASLDRFCSSSKSVRFRSQCTVQKARITILIITIVMIGFMSPTCIIYYWNTTTQECITYSDLLSNTYVMSQIFLYYIISPILIILFGILTVFNIRQQKNQIDAQRTITHNRRTEGQLARMLLLQVSAHLIFTGPFCVIYCMMVFQPSTRTPNITAIRYILVTWNQCDYFMSFFSYVLSGQVYRQQFMEIFKSIQCRSTRTHPRNDTIQQQRAINR